MNNLQASVAEITIDNARPIYEQIPNPSTPYILKNIVADWPVVAAAKESDQALVEYLKNYESDKTVVYYEAQAEKNGRFFYTPDCKSLEFTSGYAHLNQVLDRLLQTNASENQSTLYVGSTTVDICLPNFRRDNDLNFSGKDPLVSLWIGGKSTVAAHFDAPDNIACCIAGKRKFTLFPIEQIENLYVGPLDFTPSGQAISMVDFRNPDYSKHPKFREAQKHALIVNLEPGDGLYLPSMWWHQVESLSSINGLINYWWREAPRYMDAPINVLHYAMLSIRDLPEREKAAWKKLFEYYIFDSQIGKYDHIPVDARGFLQPLDEPLSKRLRTWINNKLNR